MERLLAVLVPGSWAVLHGRPRRGFCQFASIAFLLNLWLIWPLAVGSWSLLRWGCIVTGAILWGLAALPALHLAGNRVPSANGVTQGEAPTRSDRT